MSTTQAVLDGVRVIEIADERAEYAGLLLAGMGADVVKIEPPQGAATRGIGPFYRDEPGPDLSLHFWHYNRGKRSVVCDLDDPAGAAVLHELLADADVLLESTDRGDLDARGFGRDELRRRHPRLVVARVTPFGDDGPWADFKGGDLVHLALGGVAMNCGYDPRPDGTYDLPPIAPQMWHSSHIAGEQVAMGVLAALYHRGRTGEGQHLTCAIHEAVAKNTELDLMNWVMRRLPLLRQTCRHAAETVSTSPSIQQTKDGRWIMTMIVGSRDRAALAGFLERHGMPSPLTIDEEATESVRQIPGSGGLDAEEAAYTMDVVARMVRKFTYAEFPWSEAQDAGLFCSPLRTPEENVDDPHWVARKTFAAVEHPEHGRSFTYVTSKWLSTATSWKIGRRAPLLGEDTEAVLAARSTPVREPATSTVVPAAPGTRRSRYGRPFALDGIRILDFSWFLASAGGTRFLSALGAECIKVEWSAHPDTRMGAMAPVGGRRARELATAPLAPVDDADMGGQFNNKNAGKLGISLNVRHPEGMAIARRLVAMSDVVAEGFSPGVMDRWGLGYAALKEIKPDIIYAQQSGMGAHGTYGRLRAVGPIAAAFAGTSEMSGLPSPAMPAGWGYSYLDWIGAYSFATAILSALVYRQRTGHGQWIDASQTESGIFTSGTSILDWTANGRASQRTGNRSPNKPAAPHGIYRCTGTDAWIAIACGDDAEWQALVAVAGRPEWLADERFSTLAARVDAQDALDALVTTWTERHDRYELMERLQRAGVPAGVCQTAADRCESDPQLAHLEWLTEVTGTKIGRWPVAGVPVKLETTPADIGGIRDRGAPIYGEDNEFVYGELLGFSKREIARLAEDHVI